ncbi:MAG: alanine--tRNA ligase, partial [Candidatus Nealsonbacteria bacterium]|nr:alanine--tRNA ligase [Candidatus Nealsonbacteria bacterium]
FFEMLGNFSFGDYFKREAINWAWEFCTDKKWLGIDPARLSVTIYLDDEEAAGIWRNDIKLPPEKIQRLGEDENYWPAYAPSRGPDGVCGPCSEIYYHTDSGEVEIWNLVFTQFNRVGDPPDNLRPLPSKNIDTGMGLERTAAVLQGVETNYHIDILRPLVEAAAEVCGMKYDPASEQGRRMRRIADHVRACTFAVHENVYPGPNKEKYVIKRLLRRAVLDGRQMGLHDPFLHKLVPTVAELMHNTYPELTETVTRVAGVIQGEEANFLGTIDGGLDRIERTFAQMKQDHHGIVSGSEAADMYQTYGFPPELFEAMAAERNLAFDWNGYRDEMDKHGLASSTGEKIVFKHDPLEALKKAMHGSKFLGYETTEVADAKVVGLIVGENLCDKVDEVDVVTPSNDEHPITVVLDKTPFYGEMGGQVGDCGEVTGEGFRFEVVGAQVDGAFTLHLGHLREGQIKLDDTVAARVDASRRQGIRRAHSATHILHYALRNVLGQHAEQQGSKVDDDVLRFDFTHPSAVTAEELVRIENEANVRVLAGEPIVWQELPLAEAREAGAIMLFGEKYPDVVRMVSMGQFSKELCGGTHLASTGQIGLLKIVGEESVAAGTRRITALTGIAALEHVRRGETALAAAAGVLKIPTDQVGDRVEALVKEVRQLKKQVAAGAKAEGPTPETLLAEAAESSGVKIVAAEIPGGTPNTLRELIDQIRRKAGPVAVMLGSRQEEDGKVLLI